MNERPLTGCTTIPRDDQDGRLEDRQRLSATGRKGTFHISPCSEVHCPRKVAQLAYDPSTCDKRVVSSTSIKARKLSAAIDALCKEHGRAAVLAAVERKPSSRVGRRKVPDE